tara:strand:+ start:30 stop:3116 length:3087 start_codon:yes stop_codon:yes gene_type:complete
MSVKIELLDYAYGFVRGDQFNPDNSFNDPSDWEILPNGNEWVVSGGEATKITSTGAGRLKIPMTFVEGKRYRIQVKITGRTAGNFILANHLAGGANGFNYSTNGAKKYDWIQGANNLDKLSLYGSASFDGSIEYANVYPLSNIDWEKSVVGELDVDDHTDFPMALTFQISDFTKITSTSGDYSKTFKIPATKNNNTILKNIFIPNVVQENDVTAKKKCRMTFNGVFSMEGLLQIDKVAGFGAIATHYDCVFYGSNLGWAEPLANNFLHDLEWGVYGENLNYNSDSIKATWDDVDCDSSTSYLVYPITSYGDYNPDGTVKTIQLLDSMYQYAGGSSSKSGYYGWDSNGESYGTPPPSADWRPALWVKNTIEKIFQNINYEIKSDFMNTDMFKRLTWTLPNFIYNNPDTKESDFSFVGSFRANKVLLQALNVPPYSFPVPTDNGVFGTNNFNLHQRDSNLAYLDYYNGANRFTININDYDSNPSSYNLDILSNDGLMFNPSQVSGEYGTFSIKENGYYNVILTGIQSRLARGFKGGTDSESINGLNTVINLEVQTVGENRWVIVNSATNELFPDPVNVNQNVTTSTPYATINDINYRQYFNIGDKIRFTFGARLYSTTAPSQDFICNFFVKGLGSSRFSITLESEKVEYGQTFNIKNVIPTDVKQIDFIKGIAHAFNLQIQTDDVSRRVFIEPFTSFYKPYGEAIDWTQKLDRTEESSDTWVKSQLKRDVIFKYKSDNNDEKVKQRGIKYFNNIEDEFPFYETLPDTFDKGEAKFENPFFAGTFSSKDQDSVYVPEFVDNAFSGCLWTENSDPNSEARPVKGYDFLPRLLYWNRYSPAGLGNVFTNVLVDMRKYAAVQTFATTIEYLNPNSDTPVQGGIISNALPQATMTNREDILSPNLAYGNITVQNFDILTLTYADPVVIKGLYDTYYRTMIESLKRNPRIRTEYITLKISDIINLDFSKLIYIDGCYWRINKISDFKPNKNESTKVELIEWFEVGQFTAEAPQFGGGSVIITNPDGSIDANDNWGL